MIWASRRLKKISPFNSSSRHRAPKLSQQPVAHGDPGSVYVVLAPTAEITAPLIFEALFNGPQDDEEEFDRWMEDDHIPLLLECDDWLAVRRFSLPVAEPVPATRLAIHYLASHDALTSPECAAARDTEFQKRIARLSWMDQRRHGLFKAHRDRYPGLQGAD